MATLDQAIYARLQAVSAVTALVGTRIRLEDARQDEQLPYVERFEISATPFQPLAGAASLMSRRIQFTCWAASPSVADAVRAALRDALAGFSGTVSIPGTGSPADSFQIMACIPDTEQAVYDDDGAGKAYGRSIDFIFHHLT